MEPEDLEDLGIVTLRLVPTNRRLVVARRLRGWTQVYISKLGDMPVARFCSIETVRVVPTQNEMEGLADLLEMAVGELFPEALLNAIKRGVFSHRTVDLTEERVLSISAINQKLLTPPQEADDSIMLLQLKDELSSVMESLTPREQRLLELRYGLKDNIQLSLGELCKKFNISSSRVQQVESKALRKLRHPSRSRRLAGYYKDM